MADTQTPSPAATPAPFSLANWTYPRLPQPLDIIQNLGGGGGGGGGIDRATFNALWARVAALDGGSGPPPPPAITSPLTASGQVGKPFSYTIVAPGATSFNATNLPPGFTRSGAVISGTPTSVIAAHHVTITATNLEGSDTQTLVITITPAGTSVPWEVTYTFPSTVTFDFAGGGKIPLANLTGWNPSFAVDMTDDLYNLALVPNMAALPVNLYATFGGQPEVIVQFDAWPGTPAANSITHWGFDSSDQTIYIEGSNSTGNPIELRLERH